jgi:hypothetical protein
VHNIHKKHIKKDSVIQGDIRREPVAQEMMERTTDFIGLSARCYRTKACALHANKRNLKRQLLHRAIQSALRHQKTRILLSDNNSAAKNDGGSIKEGMIKAIGQKYASYISVLLL